MYFVNEGKHTVYEAMCHAVISLLQLLVLIIIQNKNLFNNNSHWFMYPQHPIIVTVIVIVLGVNRPLQQTNKYRNEGINQQARYLSQHQ